MNINYEEDNDCTYFVKLNKAKNDIKTSCCHFDYCFYENNPKLCPKYEVNKENESGEVQLWKK